MRSRLEQILLYNRRYADAADSPAGLARPPAKRLIVLTCMDGRIDPLGALGLEVGDANVLRNAGAVVTDDVVRSVEMSRTKLGTTGAVLIGHTDCAGHEGDDAAEAAIAAGLGRLRSEVPEDFEVHGLMYDVMTARLRVLGE